jgi:hypothetical protein
LLAAGFLSSCDIPTEAPQLEQDWLFPLTETSIHVGELLPADVGLTQDSSAFTVEVEPIVFEENLGTLCPECDGLDGLTVPKPAFTGEFAESVALPDEVISVQVQEGLVVVEAENQFSFDPLRPPGGERGSFILSLRDGGPTGPVLSQTTVDGQDTSFGPGESITRELEYTGAVGSTLWITLVVDSPAGGQEPGNWVLVDLDDAISVTATPEDIEAESAVIDVAGEVFAFGTTSLDVEDLSQDMVDNLVSGSLKLEVVNPWAVAGILNLTITGPTMAEPVVIIASVPATLTSMVQVELSQADLQSFLGEPNVVVVGQGTVDQGAGSVTLTPDQNMIIDTELALTILIG